MDMITYSHAAVVCLIIMLIGSYRLTLAGLAVLVLISAVTFLTADTAPVQPDYLVYITEPREPVSATLPYWYDIVLYLGLGALIITFRAPAHSSS